MTTRRRFLLPVIGRHLVRQFGATFGLTLAAFLAIYVLADFFDRIDNFLKYDASLSAILRSFIFKLPLVVSQVTPMAVLAGTLVGLGLLARQNEFVALRACGVSTWQVLVPLLAVGGLVSVGIFAWNETVVPYSSRRWHEVDDIEIRKHSVATVFTGREVWYHGKAGFYNIGFVAPRKHVLYGLTVFQIDPTFRPVRMIEADSATWDGRHWRLDDATARVLEQGEWRAVPLQSIGFELPETPDDFAVAYHEAEEFSFAMLSRQIRDLRRKGVDASESLVDLHLKIALPAASMILMLVAVPLAVRGTRVSSMTAGIGLGFGMGFAYFIVLGLARALGQSSTIPPVLAAWSANILFAMLGGFYLLGSD
jgi:lipopolysaccharide export system permease protein